MGSNESHFNVSVRSDGQSHRTASTNHNLFEEKSELKQYQTEVLPLTSLMPKCIHVKTGICTILKPYWVKSVHTSPTKLQAALLSVWFCQSLTTAIAFCRDCPKNRLNVYRQCKMLLQELSWNAKKTDHITPILRQLHWLPIHKRIRHKILSATYRSVHDNTPLYLSDLLQKHNPSRLLRSASRSLLDVPGPRDSKTKRYGQRAFRYVAPSLWNVLPESIKEKDSIQSFRPSLKTHFFTQGW